MCSFLFTWFIFKTLFVLMKGFHIEREQQKQARWPAAAVVMTCSSDKTFCVCETYIETWLIILFWHRSCFEIWPFYLVYGGSLILEIIFILVTLCKIGLTLGSMTACRLDPMDMTECWVFSELTDQVTDLNSIESPTPSHLLGRYCCMLWVIIRLQ